MTLHYPSARAKISCVRSPGRGRPKCYGYVNPSSGNEETPIGFCRLRPWAKPTVTDFVTRSSSSPPSRSDPPSWVSLTCRGYGYGWTLVWVTSNRPWFSGGFASGSGALWMESSIVIGYEIPLSPPSTGNDYATYGS